MAVKLQRVSLQCECNIAACHPITTFLCTRTSALDTASANQSIAGTLTQFLAYRSLSTFGACQGNSLLFSFFRTPLRSTPCHVRLQCSPPQSVPSMLTPTPCHCVIATSIQLTASKSGRTSPRFMGPIQPHSSRRPPPVITPGPGSYDTPTSIGKQSSSSRPSSPRYSFGSGKRETFAKQFVTEELASKNPRTLTATIDFHDVSVHCEPRLGSSDTLTHLPCHASLSRAAMPPSTAVGQSTACQSRRAINT